MLKNFRTISLNKFLYINAYSKTLQRLKNYLSCKGYFAKSETKNQILVLVQEIYKNN